MNIFIFTIQVQEVNNKIRGQLCCFVLLCLNEGKKFEEIILDIKNEYNSCTLQLKNFCCKYISDILDQVEANFLNEKGD